MSTGRVLVAIDPRQNSVAAVLGGVEDDITDRRAGRLTGYRPTDRPPADEEAVMSRSLFRKVVPQQSVPDDVDPAEQLRRQLDEGEPPVAKRHWWSVFNRGTSTMMINQPGNTGGGSMGGL